MDSTAFRSFDDVSLKARKAKRPRALLSRRNLFLIAFLLLALTSFGFAYFFVQYERLRRDPALQPNNETLSAIADLSRVMLVPDDPKAAAARIADKSLLNGQHFFDRAENGDYVIVFPSIMRMVLYRPSSGKVVDIQPVDPSSLPHAK